MASSSSVIAGLVCLGLEAAPGYISHAVSAHLRPPPTIVSPLHTPFYPVLFSPSLELSTAPLTVAEILSFTKTPIYFSSLSTSVPPLYNSVLHSLFLRPSSQRSCSRMPQTLNTPQFQYLPPTVDIDYDLLPYEAPSKSTLPSPPSIPPPPFCISSVHTTHYTTVDT
ncbi:hypothetical protein ONS95_014759 [Cadophora gregata]|uniref:uncharacterized protein n=1 Tax=Cadophora gregata TaxID=51156 RepID=UPI0026DBEEE8|nr:uncharacterized protein ONS95_014759 [Cadophora gregata]KAK0113053.1 hypothetical protein ONS95_014759 [Cadophora gregata]